MDITKGSNSNHKLLIMGAGVVAIVLSLLSLGSIGKRSPFDTATEQMESLFRKGDYPGALKKAQSRLDLAQKTFEPSAPQVTDSMHDIGAALAADGKYDQAKEWVLKSIAKEVEARHKESSELPEKLVTLAEVYERLGDHARAENYGNNALEKFATVDAQRKLSARARGFAIVAVAALAQGGCDRALKAAEQGIALAPKLGKEVDLLQSLNTSAGKAEYCLQHHEKADSYIHEAIKLAKKQKGDTELPNLMALDGEILCELGKCKQGMKLQKDGFKMAKKLLGEDSPAALKLQPIESSESSSKGSNHRHEREEPSTAELGRGSESAPGRPNGKPFENF